MKSVINFLQQLQANNNREWFHAHKEEYKAAQARFHAFAETMIAQIAQFDPTVAGLTAKDVTYRIQRDTRFSADKRPFTKDTWAYSLRVAVRNRAFLAIISSWVPMTMPQTSDPFIGNRSTSLRQGITASSPKHFASFEKTSLDGEGDFDN